MLFVRENVFSAVLDDDMAEGREGRRDVTCVTTQTITFLTFRPLTHPSSINVSGGAISPCLYTVYGV